MIRSLLLALWALCLPALLQSRVIAADHTQHGNVASAGRKMELIEGITTDDFLRLSNKPDTVELVIAAVFTDDNYGMNFNGYAKGNALYTIPKGWNVEVTFINPSPVPHSLIVVEKDTLKSIQFKEPYFKGAVVPEAPKHLVGMAYDKGTCSFVADEAGDYALACGFPGHAAAGHWIALEISADAKVPTLKLGDSEAKAASPAKATDPKDANAAK
jgi:hypothetical protein